MDRRQPTPREQLSREKRQKYLAGIQWKKSQSVEELNADIAIQEAANIEKTSPIIIYQREPEPIITNHWFWVAKKLEPRKK